MSLAIGTHTILYCSELAVICYNVQAILSIINKVINYTYIDIEMEFRHNFHL